MSDPHPASGSAGGGPRPAPGSAAAALPEAPGPAAASQAAASRPVAVAPRQAFERPRVGTLRSELPWLVLTVALWIVLLHANAPEVWFWFAALLVLLLWRTLAWRQRRWDRLQAAAQPPPSSSGSATGSPG
ncbi:MAG: hypothetical protein VKO39_09175 [Cyanobacteriota bacterium]|nr:hypothetical protein [Cyanobacteriota bacterium]